MFGLSFEELDLSSFFWPLVFTTREHLHHALFEPLSTPDSLFLKLWWILILPLTSKHRFSPALIVTDHVIGADSAYARVHLVWVLTQTHGPQTGSSKTRLYRTWLVWVKRGPNLTCVTGRVSVPQNWVDPWSRDVTLLVGQLFSPPYWSRLKYLKNYCAACHEIWRFTAPRSYVLMTLVILWLFF